MKLGILICALTALAGQAASASEPLAIGATNASAPGAPTTSGYLLGTGDKLRIGVFEELGLSGLFNIASDGTIAFPLVGAVKAAGRTPEQLEAAIAALLNDGYMKDPRVSVEVLTFRPYYILGEVAKPGEYPYSAGQTVMRAVATAGGFSFRANQKRVLIKKKQDSVEKSEILTPSVQISPGDTIRIIERIF